MYTFLSRRESGMRYNQVRAGDPVSCTSRLRWGAGDGRRRKGGAGRHAVARGPGLPRLWVGLESRSSTAGHTHAHIHTSAHSSRCCPHWLSTSLHWDGLVAEPLAQEVTVDSFALSPARSPLPSALSLSRPEPVNTFTQQRIAEGLTSGLDLSFTCREFRSLSSPIAAWVP